jgi:FlaA1/EpsC-like NDP-sugar epimerase
LAQAILKRTNTDMNQILRRLTDMDRSGKIMLVVVADAGLIVVAAWLALYLRMGDPWDELYIHGLCRLVMFWLIAGGLLSFMMELPWIAIRSIGPRSLVKILLLSTILSVFGFILNLTFEDPTPRSVPFIFGLLLLVLMAGLRMAVGWLFTQSEELSRPRDRVLIYGAGAAGQQLARALDRSDDTLAVAFVDDDPKKQNMRYGALKVHAPERIEALLRRHEVNKIVLAIPSLPRERRREVLRRLQGYNRKLLTLPHFENFIGSGSLSAQLRAVTAEDLLGRSTRKIDLPEIKAAYAGQVVMVTGAGGSIGSELCRQIVKAGARVLVLFDISEVALYQIHRELEGLQSAARLVPVLGSVADAAHVKQVILTHEVGIILHAAAYKHVPLIESNEVAGAANNALGTRTLALAAEAAGVRQFILVSTDKAVRPTNVMGASKRFSELVIQDLQMRSRGTTFAMVRFGNVLDSSGSVIPLFREQIARGGPVTVTHPEVTRFFMTIAEAVQLVLLAGTFAKGGDVFVLDMGEPVKIVDLARNLIALSGLQERQPGGTDGDIEIRFTGLRPGEKLYEELLLGSNLAGTPHPKIMCAHEAHLSEFETASAVKRLEQAVRAGNARAVREVFLEVVDGFCQDLPEPALDAGREGADA